MTNAIYAIEPPPNETILSYAPGTGERKAIRNILKELRNDHIEIPLIIGGKEIRTGNTKACVIPHDHQHQLGIAHQAGPDEVQMAIEAAMAASKQWAAMAWQDRLAIFKKAAELIAGPYRMLLNGATILGQGKNLFQAEIDSACELIDFLRFNSHYARKIFAGQPLSTVTEWNQLEYRPLEGFVFAVTPFNFTAIAGNLPSSPAMLGNTLLWKPASSALYSAYYLMKIFHEAGMPEGVINFIPGPGSQIGPLVLQNRNLAGIHFTGSTEVFQGIWKTVGQNIHNYRSYPRIVGETGGKDFIFIHRSADIQAGVTATIRGAFEYQGQKCSAASRLYVPKSLWADFKQELLSTLEQIKTGSPEDFSNFVNAVIDRSCFEKITAYIEQARKDESAEIIAGGTYDDSTGFFIDPTVIVARKPDYTTMVEEIFGPVLTIFIYDDNRFEETLELCDQTSDYALTGAVFAQDRNAVITARSKLVNSAGNFYINDKPTGAVVGQQPFGGGRASGTNDKAGSILNLYRWLNPRTIKENFVPAKDFRYPFMNVS
ncbi:MAG: L-glutamate gamma-semialdehyde dehydrogenase [Desulfobacteraceae bacterium]|nr:L-glutamate gamma-semialdehyde dehydrogenase [Desulfobacteraceae bacterium]